ncbi:MAG TPA: hypothetical protein VIK68_10605, partial [Sphingomicrobium sp.]
MVRKVDKGAVVHANRRASLLRACAIAALLVRPAVAAPPSIPQVTIEPVRAGPGNNRAPIDFVLSTLGKRGPLTLRANPLRAQPVASATVAPVFKVDRGLFDIELSRPPDPGRNERKPAIAMPIAPVSSPFVRRGVADELLVTGNAAPAANSAR